VLKKLIISKGVKQKWIAEQLGVSEVTVSNWVKEKAIPKEIHLKNLADLLGIPIDQLINEDQSAKSSKTLKSYLNDDFYSDQLKMQKAGINCLCNRSWLDFFQKDLHSEVADLKSLVICLYELNLIDQVIYTHFNSEHKTWKEFVKELISCRCTYMSSPIEIFKWVQKHANDNKVELKITKNEIIVADEFFMEFLEDFINKSESSIMSKKSILDIMSSDPDCDPEQLIKYLK